MITKNIKSATRKKATEQKTENTYLEIQITCLLFILAKFIYFSLNSNYKREKKDIMVTTFLFVVSFSQPKLFTESQNLIIYFWREA